jgi:hypothetical protein
MIQEKLNGHQHHNFQDRIEESKLFVHILDRL